MTELKPFKLLNATRGTGVAVRARQAENPWARFKGLMGASPLPEGEALVISPSSSIHTHFMRFSIDVLYLDRHDTVVGIDRDLRPWRFGRFYKGAKYVVEMSAGGAQGCQVGDRIERQHA